MPFTYTRGHVSSNMKIIYGLKRLRDQYKNEIIIIANVNRNIIFE